ncbi:hypothetical protein AXK59_01260 [Tsukamurella tyrosinosolvens]|nr:hypothetical protein AXK59_01260 [Tsukamurella tyrosinosolvens]
MAAEQRTERHANRDSLRTAQNAKIKRSVIAHSVTEHCSNNVFIRGVCEVADPRMSCHATNECSVKS